MNIFERMSVPQDEVKADENKTYQPLRNLIALCEAEDATKRDHIVPMSALKAEGRTVVIEGKRYTLNHKNGMTQLCVKAATLTNEDDDEIVGRLPAAWMMEKGGSFASETEYILNSRFAEAQDLPDKKFLFRTHNGKLRAALSSTYPTFGGDAGFENTTMLKAVLTTFEQLNAQEARIARCRIDADSIRARVFFKDIDTANVPKLNSFYAGKMWLGAVISNDETGNGGFKVGPAALRHSCNNSYHHADKDAGYFELTHTGNVIRFQRALKEAMEACVEGSLELIERLIEAENVKVDFDALAEKAIEKFGWQQKTKTPDINGKLKTQYAIPEKYMGVVINLKSYANDTSQMSDTLAGFVNAITRAAHAKDDKGEFVFAEEDQYSMEQYATEMLYR